MLFILYASVQAKAHYDTLRMLEQIQLENQKLQRVNENLRNELKKKQQELEKAKQAQNNNTKVAYLTFDDGPSTNTEEILAILDRYKIKATFFVIGNNSEFGKQMYRRIVSKGHALGLHSYSHEYRNIYTSATAFHSDMEKLRQLIYKATGQKPKIMRFPGGSNNHISRKYGGHSLMQILIQQSVQKGYKYFDWNVDSQDAKRKVQPRDVIIQSVMKESRNKKKIIVLMHDSQIKVTTVQALPAIITELKKQGFSFDILSDTSFTYHFTLEPPTSKRGGSGR
ncbi:polysaccharide deacetylase [Aneurinibacillus thermoaerophilus]|uniref:Peptidoglycan/xylan/chitin deacetylase, PgdA/CDA1 family n=2 Tax=Aneurinibacillus thermoaerophilus TaxID=143495 RepID=A0A1G8C9N3_ANETH|nr:MULTISPECIES: polysaccharide deacetylase family protein [Aneurinibacillus]AMA71549.1 hypothetical protein ACH33_01000 [Aneurinibacillus sp. XH2]MED0757334.1 polysaccharide deacetylase [Aneurinibacillus thermoaerophilus]MED0761465.1 polysaccharide deacetylase [Aneurinibacillus thermoaerophilus]MED0765134.1 polysaccharide deacetylase [Aneurinibacillus thermoaerophilus]SDH42186.1 Peptidoglycan/xylan/chitin deacetylase, PgdA/CDA1 family [Aneurinibacillus thermoaerophilus]